MKKKIFNLLIFIYIGFIFSNSLKSAYLSDLDSGFVTTVVNQVFDVFTINVPFEMLHHLIRKLAHFSEYLILGILLTISYHKYPLSKHKLSYLIFIITPIIDETIQTFSPGRCFAINDILIDSLGLLVGFLSYKLVRSNQVEYNGNEKR